MNLTSYNDTELQKLQEEINKEILRRDSEEQKKAWKQVKSTIQEYVTKYGFIYIHDGYDSIDLSKEYINDDNTFRNMGEICFTADL